MIIYDDEIPRPALFLGSFLVLSPSLSLRLYHSDSPIPGLLEWNGELEKEGL
jgi:hypothetical protein